MIDENARLNNRLQQADAEIKRQRDELEAMRKPKVPALEPPACQPTPECDVAGCEASSACVPPETKTP
jgi:hypothetical protein